MSHAHLITQIFTIWGTYSAVIGCKFCCYDQRDGLTLWSGLTVWGLWLVTLWEYVQRFIGLTLDAIVPHFTGLQSIWYSSKGILKGEWQWVRLTERVLIKGACPPRRRHFWYACNSVCTGGFTRSVYGPCLYRCRRLFSLHSYACQFTAVNMPSYFAKHVYMNRSSSELFDMKCANLKGHHWIYPH